jgi:hypothetical protein
MNGALAYGSGAAAASLFYILWFVIQIPHQGVGLGFRIGLALFFWLVQGFCLALVLLSAPWIMAVKLYPRWRWPGWVYFASIGAIFTFAISCATASLSPKPLFIEDQTFFEGARIAAERQGLCFGLAGMVHGITYWFIGQRGLRPRW